MTTQDFLLKNLKKALERAVSEGQAAESIALSKEVERLDAAPRPPDVERLEKKIAELDQVVSFLKAGSNMRNINTRSLGPGQGVMG